MAEPRDPVRYKLVIGIDFDATGDAALAEALRIAREHPNDELHAVHVVKTGGTNAKALDELSDEMAQAAKKLQMRVHAVSELVFPGEEWEQDVVFHVRLGSPAEALHQVAVDYDADVIVVGTHARKGMSKVILGSVADELVRTAHVAVLVARVRDFSGMAKSARPDPKREGEVRSDEHYQVSERVTFGRGRGHIAGLI